MKKNFITDLVQKYILLLISISNDSAHIIKNKCLPVPVHLFVILFVVATRDIVQPFLGLEIPRQFSGNMSARLV